MRTMTKERKKEGPRLGHKGRAEQKPAVSCCFCVSRRSSVISCSTIYRWEPQSSFRSRIINSPRASSAATGAALQTSSGSSSPSRLTVRCATRCSTVFCSWCFSPVTNVIIALLLFEITSRRRLKTYQTIITFPNFMSMVIVGYIVYAILSPRTGLMNQIIQFFGGDRSMCT